MVRGKIYANRYIVTDDGQVFAMKYRNRQLIGRLRPHRSPNARCGGYLQVSVNGRRRDLHRIVAECFVPKPPGEGLEVNHKDGDKLNNRASNLEWTTHLENVRHAYRTGLITGAQIARNAAHPHPTMRTITTETAKRIKKLICDGHPNCVIAEMLGVKDGVVSSIRLNTTFKDVRWPRGKRRDWRFTSAEAKKALRRYRFMKQQQEDTCKS